METMMRSFAKLYHSMRLQRPGATTTDYIESISKARHDKNVADDHTKTHPCDELDASDTSYNSWLIEHPSALRCFKDMISNAKGKKIVVFLDYDGTLSPIVNDPNRAFMSDSMRSAVCEVARRFPTAIISGRSRDKMLGELEKKTSKIQGVMIEDNRFCISVHYRHVHQEDYDMLQERVQCVLAKYSSFHLTKGKKVMEIRPSIKWNKGDAVEYLLDTLGLASSSDVLPIYIGDDRTDEDAFKVVRSRGGEGYPIIVSSTPRETMASYSLRDPSEVFSFLISLARFTHTSSY
ncbi:probable trehalose-phosphate phosphatase D isoform X3 [Camellia sinensis]|uniref:probable trehalose-phosphate phosphatase D isoform X3 n=1 Tax=Camellia sinensis TaxID=4442 RepID=UPI001036B593|nr:probable trehalose-phosphate phosphatase D isoform X3 [Camellia sinensis]